MEANPLITGIGLCTPLGNSTAATWDALLAGRFITNHSRASDIPPTHSARVNSIAVRAAREATTVSGWGAQDVSKAGLIVGTSKGPVDSWLTRIGEGSAAGELSPLFGLSETAAVLGAEFHCKGPRLTISAACAGGLIALIRGAMMIQSGEVERVMVVAAESSLHPLFLASFNRLGVLPTAGHGCRPFDKSRGGFVVSEAAAAICLESDRRRAANRAPAIAIDRFAVGADATHLTGGDPNGASLRRIISRVIDARPLDLIHAHGTGTVANDPVELMAIQSCLPDDTGALPSLYSHKGALGHSLGASGLAAVVINCLCHRHGIIPPNVQTREPLETSRVLIEAIPCKREVHRSMCIAAGFGGAIAAVSLRSTS